MGATMLAGVGGAAAPAWADCGPEPAAAGQTVNCSGQDSDGLTVSANGVSVVVAAGATVSERPDRAGAIVLQASSGLTANLDNSGAISSANGAALTSATNPGVQAFQLVNNRSGATISGATGGINAIVGRLTNAGTIDGGTGSAYATPNVTQIALAPTAVFNTGSIVSNGSVATISFPILAPQQFGNSGRIVNSGTGAAIEGGIGLTVVNEATGVIGSAGPVAIRSGQLVMLNAGTINGSVVGGSSFDSVDTRAGTINGDLSLGAGDDKLIATIGTSRLIGSVTGTVDAGAGNDFLELIVDRDHGFTASPLAFGFERLQLDLTQGATLTLSGTVPQGGYSIRGNGTIRIGADMSSTGPLIIGQIAQQNLGAERLNFTNEKTLQATLSNTFDAVVSLENVDAVYNGGSIIGSGGGGAFVRLNTDGKMTNAGLISATATGLTVSGSIENSGSIRSSGGIALSNDLGGGGVRGRSSVNTGTIEGYTTGARISSLVFTNSGTVTASNGIGIIASDALIDNLAGGLISGATAGVQGYATFVRNAGTITGNVDLAAFGSSQDMYIDRGGTVNGNVLLGAGDDYFVTDLARGTSGVTGTVDPGAGRDTLRLTVDADATVAVQTPGSFEVLGYELSNGATLHLSQGAPVASLEFGGTGKVDMTVDLSGSTGPAIQLNPSSTAQLLDPTGPIDGNLSLISRGTIDFDVAGGFSYPAAVRASQGFSSPFQQNNRFISFENAGTLNVTGPADGTFSIFGIEGGNEIINSGTINLTSSVMGIARAQKVVNTGSIVQVDQSHDAIGVYAVTSLINSGSIVTNGPAVLFSTGVQLSTPTTALDNSGLVESRNGAALSGSLYNFASSTIHNAATGIIRGNGTAISISGKVDLVNEGQIFGKVELGNVFGSDEASLTNSGTITGDVAFGYYSDRFIQTGTVQGSIAMGDGDDRFTNTGHVTGNVDLGDGADRYVLTATGVVDGIVSGGAGTDSAVLSLPGSGTTVFDPALLVHIADFEQLAIEGGGTLRAAGSIPLQSIEVGNNTLEIAAGTRLDTLGPITVSGDDGAGTVMNSGTIGGGVALGGGNDLLDNHGTILGAVDLGAGDDTLDNQSSIVGPVDLGAGADTVILRGVGSFGGAISGGADNDVVRIQTGGMDAAPTELNLAGFSQFEVLRNAAGTTAISGSANFQQIDVAAGRLIGRANSVLVGNVSVASGATFGSAGTVVGNVAIASGATLAPGASPGTMTVQGNVSLASGSTSVFEFTPTASDKLLISGALAIGANATLNMTGERPLTPGVAYDLVVADGGITGTFATINKAAAVQGFVLQTGTRLQLLGTFVAPAGTGVQAGAAIDYVNGVLVAGQGSQALLGKVASLVDSNGAANGAAFAQLTPEAYGTVQQLGVDHGLLISQAVRDGAGRSPLPQPGGYAFAQGVGNWSRLAGSADIGTQAARDRSSGLLGGIGYGDKSMSFGIFVGYLDSAQRINGLGASTDAEDTIAGIAGHAVVDGFDLGILIAYDWGRADTTRAVPGGTARSNRYALDSLVLDVSAGYTVNVSSTWVLRPAIGLTHIRVDRDRISEAGSAAFALDVDGDRSSATFVDAALGLRGGEQDGSRFHPWIEAGLRHQMSGNIPTAWGGFVGLSSRFGVAGAQRAKTSGLISAGTRFDLSRNLEFFVSYDGAFGREAHTNNINGGMRLAF